MGFSCKAFLALALKFALREVGIEYPRKHDVSLALLSGEDRFPEWFQPRIEEFCEISAKLADLREPSMYGDEDAGLLPEEVFGRDDAKGALKDAREVMEECRKLSQV